MPPAAMPHDLAYTSATQLSQMLRQRQIGAVELLELFLERVERINPQINAIVAFDLDAARSAARKADTGAGGDAAGLLAGLPMSIKETYGAKGMRTTCGLPFLADNLSQEDAVAVARLRAEGAVIFGKSNVPIGGADHQTYNPIYGTTNNPWDTARTPGGSSGGAAAALAAGLTPLELGSDIGGSIRIPAHMCGVFGHKATYGLIPTLGHVPPMPGTLTEPELAVAGPLARTAVDLELGVDVLTRGAPGTRSAQFGPSRHEKLADFRVALLADNLPFPATRETQSAIDDLGVALAAAGAKVSRVARPGFTMAQAFETYLRSLFSIVLGGQPLRLDHATRARLNPDARWYADILEQCADGTGPSQGSLVQQRLALRAQWQDFFRDWDALICPAFPSTAFVHDQSGEGIEAQLVRRCQVDATDIPYIGQLAWPSLATVANLPATTVPVPRQPGQLPLGLQLIGPEFADRTTIRLADLIERELGYGFVPPPGY